MNGEHQKVCHTSCIIRCQ